MREKADVKIVYLPLGEIHDYEHNPRDNDKAVDAVARSIQRFGVRSPAIVDKDNVLIAGHTRIKAAKQLGMTEFPCIRADDLTKNQVKAYRLADNRIQEDSIWDIGALQEEFGALKNTGFDLGDTGFNSFEIAGIDFNPESLDASSVEPEEYDTPEMASGEWEPEPEGDDEVPTITGDTFVCILCCNGEGELRMAAELIGETGVLKSRYTVTQVRAMLEGDPDAADAGV